MTAHNIQIAVSVPHVPADEVNAVTQLLTSALHEAVPDELVSVQVEVQPHAEPQHIIELDDKGDWTLQHPMSERPNLTACPYNKAIKIVRGATAGRYYCFMEEATHTESGQAIPVVFLGDRIEPERE